MSEDGKPAGAGAAKVPGRESLLPVLKRRFYVAITVEETGSGFEIRLDDRPLRTPGKTPLRVPTRRLAEALAEEWAGQLSSIDPETMPLTRLVNTAIDGVQGELQAVRDDIAAYAGSDLTCYRAEAPAELVAEQDAAWNPVLAWARERLGANFVIAHGIMPVAQPDGALERIGERLHGEDCWALTALHQMTTLSGSALLALACREGWLEVEDAWRRAHVDEDCQIRMWGEDQEAAERRARRWQDMRAAALLLKLVAR